MRRATCGRVAAIMASTAAVFCMWAAAGFACTNLATMTLSSGVGHPGDTIILTGTSFPVPRATSGAPPTPVVLRWKASDGPIIGTVVPDRTGTIAVTFTVPPSDPGNVVILGLQKRPIVNPDNPDAAPTVFVDEPGTPARATFRVLAPGETAPPRVIAGDFAATGGDLGTTALIVLMVLFGAVAMSLFAGGVIAFLHQVRTRKVMQPQPQLESQPWGDWRDW